MTSSTSPLPPPLPPLPPQLQPLPPLPETSPLLPSDQHSTTSPLLGRISPTGSTDLQPVPLHDQDGLPLSSSALLAPPQPPSSAPKPSDRPAPVVVPSHLSPPSPGSLPPGAQPPSSAPKPSDRPVVVPSHLSLPPGSLPQDFSLPLPPPPPPRSSAPCFLPPPPSLPPRPGLPPPPPSLPPPVLPLSCLHSEKKEGAEVLPEGSLLQLSGTDRPDATLPQSLHMDSQLEASSQTEKTGGDGLNLGNEGEPEGRNWLVTIGIIAAVSILVISCLAAVFGGICLSGNVACLSCVGLEIAAPICAVSGLALVASVTALAVLCIKSKRTSPDSDRV